ncbi:MULTISPECIES: ribosomal protection-like ABC-F family protein [Clostridium]|uniref:ABC transporter ATP-binding protein YheS n=3 Tax=Clostridium TaxID=1485 RepID=D8GIA2_CLOLD|nr:MULTISPECIES: ABC-F type ribosomal protection protein [Clostridium]ADK14964.1 predicted ABC transporter with duplicated ATPase domain [Clostridium ljungdahlii DSM 13528]AGY78237.1 ABC-F type ribosomal protection protein [Clostridium autoethanogenum DSM 10061]ALU38369.1 ABC-type transporter with duplicated ATPase [Clostridium autoethanogenum DSM 10061]OAA87623.1 putative ABC transporter ATP-binding protein YheS [Clostridium ljungdahlii DSM 13528]OVY51125.1 putative ABC transporter ATP-bindin
MLILEAVNLKKYYGDRLIISTNDLKIRRGDKIGIVGENGAGKTTLLNILSGETDADTGVIRRYCSTAYIKQFSDENVNTQGKLFKEFGVNDKIDCQKASGGERAKLSIAAELSKNSSLLLADEPTSNLDYKSIKVLKEKFSKVETIVLISHDRDFMDTLCNKIIEIRNGKLFFYEGNYSFYKKQKDLKIKKQKMEYEEYIEEKVRLEKTTRDVQSKSKSMKKTPKRMGNSEARLHKRAVNERKKKLDSAVKGIKSRIEKLQVKEKPDKILKVKIDFSLTNPPQNKIIMVSSNFCFKYNKNEIFRNAKFKVYNGMKTAVVGDNGSGKTTLLNLINMQDEQIYTVPKAVIGYFHQNFEDLDFDKTVLQNVMVSSIQSESCVRTILARLLIFGDAVSKKVGVLSGGEKIKVSFAKLFASKANVLLLDEPTNYLDMQSIVALEDFLKVYEGTVLFVSHDRAFINSVADRLFILENEKITEFEGNLEQFEKSKNVPKNQENIYIEKSILQMKLTEIVSRMSLKDCDKEALDKEYQCIAKQLNKM